MYTHEFRPASLSVATLQQINSYRAFEIYEERFANPSNFTIVFTGSFKVDKIKPLLEKYLGYYFSKII